MSGDNLYKILDNQKTEFSHISELKNIISKYGHTNISLSFVDCFSYGIIVGKRMERAKKHDRKRKRD